MQGETCDQAHTDWYGYFVLFFFTFDVVVSAFASSTVRQRASYFVSKKFRVQKENPTAAALAAMSRNVYTDKTAGLAAMSAADREDALAAMPPAEKETEEKALTNLEAKKIAASYYYGVSGRNFLNYIDIIFVIILLISICA